MPYLLETDAGQVFAGFLVEKSDQQVVLRDIKNQLIRVPASEVVTLEQQQKSLMPELVLRDVTAQDAADLLAYLASLNSATQHVGRFRLLGPFAGRDADGLENELSAGTTLGAAGSDGQVQRRAGRTCTWEEVQCETKGRTNRLRPGEVQPAARPADRASRRSTTPCSPTAPPTRRPRS